MVKISATSERHFRRHTKILVSRLLIFMETIALCLLLNKPHLFSLTQNRFNFIQLRPELSAD
jgi:hypothetical protein